jgi:exopolysaccharide biosynthesis polyprenyl glycosylphosphotransferase
MLKALEMLDILLLVLALCLAAVASYYSYNESVPLVRFLEMRISVRNFLALIVFVLGGHLSLSVAGLYHSRRLSTRINEELDILKATTLGSVVLFIAAHLFHFIMVTPVFIGVFWATSTLLLALCRFGLRRLLEMVRLRGRNLRSVVIVGMNPRTLQFVDNLKARPELGYILSGFVDDQWAGSEPRSRNGHTLICNLAEFPSYLRTHVVDEVVIGLPVKSLYHEAAKIVALCEEQGVVVRYLSSLFNPRLANARAEEFGEEAVITFHSGILYGWPLIVKRLLDISVSAVLLILLIPLLLVTALLIKLTTKGPVFFVQHRVGLNKRRFRLFKFRTMLPDAEDRMDELEQLNEMDGPVFKIRDDPRITPVGRFLRRTSIDELPQLFNVLKGDMSLVGPRPLPVRDYNGFDQDWQRRRFSVRPGITCLWQINGRSSITFDEWMELDMQYIDAWSFWLDIRILAKTIPAVLKGSGAA